MGAFGGEHGPSSTGDGAVCQSLFCCCDKTSLRKAANKEFIPAHGFRGVSLYDGGAEGGQQAAGVATEEKLRAHVLNHRHKAERTN